jgi:hypothetical protein
MPSATARLSRTSRSPPSHFRQSSEIPSWPYCLYRDTPQGPSGRCASHPASRMSTASTSASLVVSAPPASCQLATAASVERSCQTTLRLHLQVFSTSWRFDPPRTYRPCFMPAPLLGFVPSRALFPSCSRTPSPTPLPSRRYHEHTITLPPIESLLRTQATRTRAQDISSRTTTSAIAARPQGFAPHENPPRAPAV